MHSCTYPLTCFYKVLSAKVLFNFAFYGEVRNQNVGTMMGWATAITTVKCQEIALCYNDSSKLIS